MGSIEQTEEYNGDFLFSPSTEKTLKYDSIRSDKVYIRNRVNNGNTVNLDIANIDAGNNGYIVISTYKGDLSLGNVQTDYIAASTQQGNITISGTINATGEGSSISISRSNGEVPGGDIILNSANLSNVALWSNSFDSNYQIVQDGTIKISGNTTLSNTSIKADSVKVEDGAKLTLEDVVFSSLEESNTGKAPNTGLVLGDNVTLTLSEGETLNVRDLTLGNGVDIIIELSKETFASLENQEFDIFTVEEGNIDLSSVNFVFTDGKDLKGGTISAEGGTISVTNTKAIPEPATATLSLLALAGLAVRRRRK